MGCQVPQDIGARNGHQIMLWYALTLLFVGGTIPSNMVEGWSGISSTTTTAAITVNEWVVPVRSLSGLAPPSGGAAYVEMEESDTIDVGGTETMTYTAAIYRNEDAYWTCRTASAQLWRPRACSSLAPIRSRIPPASTYTPPQPRRCRERCPFRRDR